MNQEIDAHAMPMPDIIAESSSSPLIVVSGVLLLILSILGSCVSLSPLWLTYSDESTVMTVTPCGTIQIPTDAGVMSDGDFFFGLFELPISILSFVVSIGLFLFKSWAFRWTFVVTGAYLVYWGFVLSFGVNGLNVFGVIIFAISAFLFGLFLLNKTIKHALATEVDVYSPEPIA